MEQGGRRGESGEGRGRTEAGSEGDASLPALKTAEGATGQEMQAASASWKRQGNGFSPRDSRKGHSSATTWIFAQRDPCRTSAL